MPLKFTRLLIAAASSAALVLSSPSYAWADQDPASFAADGSGLLVDDETTPIRPTSVYPGSSTGSGIAVTPSFCVGGIGGDCDEWYTNPYGHKVLVTDDTNDYVKSKHGISKGMIRWSIENGRYDSSIGTNTSTRRGYRTPVRRMDCDPSCHDAGVQVDVISIVDWAGHGKNKGELVTMYCAGYSGMCPKWIRAL